MIVGVGILTYPFQYILLLISVTHELRLSLRYILGSFNLIHIYELLQNLSLYLNHTSAFHFPHSLQNQWNCMEFISSFDCLLRIPIIYTAVDNPSSSNRSGLCIHSISACASGIIKHTNFFPGLSISWEYRNRRKMLPVSNKLTQFTVNIWKHVS